MIKNGRVLNEILTPGIAGTKSTVEIASEGDELIDDGNDGNIPAVIPKI